MARRNLMRAVVGILIVSFIYSRFPKKYYDQGKNTLTINGHVFRIDVADSETLREKGLSGREKMAEDEGMLFVFPRTDRYLFWMKDMRFPLDFIWISGNKVVGTTQNVPAPPENMTDRNLQTFTSPEAFDKALEINAGIVGKLNIQKGNLIKTGNSPD